MFMLELLSSTAQFILETTFKASVLAILILLIQLPLRNKIPAKWLHALWLLLIIRMLIPFELESKISMFNLFPLNNNQQMVENTFVFPIETQPIFETKNTLEQAPIITPTDFPETSKQV